MGAVSPYRHQDWEFPGEFPGWFVLLGAGLSPCILRLMLAQNIWKISHSNFNPRQGLWALVCG